MEKLYKPKEFRCEKGHPQLTFWNLIFRQYDQKVKNYSLSIVSKEI